MLQAQKKREEELLKVIKKKVERIRQKGGMFNIFTSVPHETAEILWRIYNESRFEKDESWLKEIKPAEFIRLVRDPDQARTIISYSGEKISGMGLVLTHPEPIGAVAWRNVDYLRWYTAERESQRYGEIKNHPLFWVSAMAIDPKYEQRIEEFIKLYMGFKKIIDDTHCHLFFSVNTSSNGSLMRWIQLIGSCIFGSPVNTAEVSVEKTFLLEA